MDVLVFSGAEEVALVLNGACVGRLRAGEAAAHDMPGSFLFRTEYAPGTLEAVSYSGGKEVSRTALTTAGAPARIRLTCESGPMRADADALACVRAQLLDARGVPVPDADVRLRAEVTGSATLLGFGSGNPVTDDNYTRGECTAFRGMALAVLRAAPRPGAAKLTVTAEGVGCAEIEVESGERGTGNRQ